MKLQRFIFYFLTSLPVLMLAAGGEGGFQQEATSMLESLRGVIVAVVGVVATIALIWQFAQGFMGRKTWADIFEASLWILGAGAAVTLATWIFTKGQSINF